MNIGQASKRSGLSTKQIRHYEKLGLLSNIKRTENGYRIYDEEVIERLTFIKNARSVYFSLDEIRQLLSLKDSPHHNHTNEQVRKVTKHHIRILNEKIVSLTEVRNLLSNWHIACEDSLTPECPILNQLQR